MKFKVIVPYWYTLEATIEAKDEEEAREKFDNLTTDECKEHYHGLCDIMNDEVTEITEEKKTTGKSIESYDGTYDMGDLIEDIEDSSLSGVRS